MPRNDIELVRSWKTSDGIVYMDSAEARKHQELLDLTAFIDQVFSSPVVSAEGLAKHILTHRIELFEILGFDPRDI